MAEIISAGNQRVYRLTNTGSPATTYAFSPIVSAVMVDYASGGVPAYVALDRVADTGSQSLLMLSNTFRTFDVYTGSVSIMASGTTGSVEVNLVGVW